MHIVKLLLSFWRNAWLLRRKACQRINSDLSPPNVFFIKIPYRFSMTLTLMNNVFYSLVIIYTNFKTLKDWYFSDFSFAIL